MNINRHNYEEYFILYMDNELGSEELQQVEAFVHQNPDLKEELDLLLQSKLTPEPHILFENKDELLKTTNSSAINLSNYEEWLVLYLDNELSVEEKTAVENFIASHPVAKTDLSIFSKTKIRPEENIVFPGKELLYRRTERAPLISMRWWKVAAAAFLIMGIGISAVFILNSRKSSFSGPMASKEIKGTNNSSNQSTLQKGSKDQTNPSLATNENKNEIVIDPEKQQLKKTAIQKPQTNTLAVQKNIPGNLKEPLKKDAPLIADNTPTNNLPSSIGNPNANIQASSVPDIAIADIQNKLNSNQAESGTVTNSPDKPYINTRATEKPEANYASLEEGSNKKSRGFFRKLTRFFEKTTKINPANDDDRVLIGAVALKLK